MSSLCVIVIQFERVSLLAYLQFISLWKIVETSETSEGRSHRATSNLYLTYCPSACTYQNVSAGKETYYAMIHNMSCNNAGLK